MKKIIVLFVMLLSLNSFAQDADFVPSWYIVEKDCQYSDGTENGGTMTDKLSVGEAVFVYEKTKGIFLGISPAHHELFIKGTLTKIVDKGKLGIITDAVSLMDTDLSIGESFWVINIDAGTQQATILIAGGQKINIPSKSISVLDKFFSKVLDTLMFVPAQP